MSAFILSIASALCIAIAMLSIIASTFNLRKKNPWIPKPLDEIWAVSFSAYWVLRIIQDPSETAMGVAMLFLVVCSTAAVSAAYILYGRRGSRAESGSTETATSQDAETTRVIRGMVDKLDTQVDQWQDSGEHSEDFIKGVQYAADLAVRTTINIENRTARK